MEAPIAAALTGVLRAATAVEEELELIARAHPREGFPHTALLESLPSVGELRSKTDSFCEEVATYASEHALTTLTATSRQLSSLHSAAQGIRSAVEWSSRFTAIDSWVNRRIVELGLPNKKVLIAPGRLGDFSIERTSRFRELLIELGEGGCLLSGDNGELTSDFHSYRDALDQIHLLRVPASDGISPAWHPLVLGHELAHLRYTEHAVREWTRGANDSNSELVRAAIDSAERFAGQAGVQLMRSPWINQLERWLAEIACDSVAICLYGTEGLEALKTFLTAYAVPVASTSHPASELRIAIQEATDVSDLTSYAPPGDQFASPETQATSALIKLSLQLRDHIRAEIDRDFDPTMQLADSIAESVAQALSNGSVPSSSDWPAGKVAERASAIESGLVRGLWRRYVNVSTGLPGSESELKRDVDFVSQAIDALEFAARFDSQREELRVEAEERMPVPNVLWLNDMGVHTKAPTGESGAASYDLRLGRHFIVFQRSAVAHIDSLGGEDELSAIQHPMEVGWGDGFILHPHELVLAATFERLYLDNTCCAQVLSRSSLGRLGLLSATAVQIHPGYKGTLTFELVNLANVPLRVSPGQRVAQIVPIPVLGSSEGYDGGYQNAGAKPAFSRSKKDWDAEILKRMRGKTL